MNGTLIARARAAIATPKTNLLVSAPPPRQSGKLVVAIDATSSRTGYWDAAKALHDLVLQMLPERCEVALAVYHNSVDTFTPFVSNRRKLRDLAAAINCDGLMECLPEVLARAVNIRDVAAVINITDMSAACAPVACRYAEALRSRGTRVFILLDPPSACVAVNSLDIFARIARRTGGAVLPFHASSLPNLLRYLNASKVGADHEQ